MILLYATVALLVRALVRLGRRGVDVLQIWLQLQGLVDLRHIAASWASYVAEGVRVVDEAVGHAVVRRLGRLLALLRLLGGHIDLIVLDHAPRVRATSVLGCLGLLHIDVTSL